MSYELNSSKPPITSDAKLTQWNEKKSNWNKLDFAKIQAALAKLPITQSLQWASSVS